MSQPLHIHEDGPRDGQTIFFCSGWRVNQLMMSPITTLYARKGFHVITATYPFDVLVPNMHDTKRNLHQLTDLLGTEIAKFSHKNAPVIFGTSLGGYLATMVANKEPQIKKVILNGVGCDVAETVWGWDKTRPPFNKFKKVLVDVHETLSKLQIDIYGISPEHNLAKFGEKDVLQFTIEHDEVIPHKFQSALSPMLEKHTHSLTVVKNSTGGHIRGCFTNMLNIKAVNKFINSNT